MSIVLPTRMVEKPWSQDCLPAPFMAPAGQRIGEIWFEPPALMNQLLIKYIFTSEALSVQVHPSDDQLPGHGKEECWLVIAAEPGAKLGIGFRETVSEEQMHAAALDGSVEQLMAWHPVKTGDFFYIPAGTVHAIGPGISLIEVQQNSDVTYRLYDYGRPRELHLDAAIAVASGQPYPAVMRKTLEDGGHIALVTGPKFQIDRIDREIPAECAKRYAGAPLLVIPMSGTAQIGNTVLHPGQCGIASTVDQISLTGKSLITQPV